MKKAVLTSTLAILIAGPVMAAVGDATFTAGQNVANSCVVGVLGVDTGTAQTNAYWTTNTYACDPGTYLPDGDTWSSDGQYSNYNCAQCLANNVCTGSPVGGFTYSEAADQGIASCSSLTSGSYTLSDSGTSTVDKCYRICASGDVAHLKSGGTMIGRYYYDSTNTCEPANASQCATGYHYVAAGPDLNNLIDGYGVGAVGYGYISNDGSSRSNASTYGLANNGTFAVDYGTGKGKITGKSQCSTEYGDNLTEGGPTERATLPDASGGNCWCSLDGYTPSGSSSSQAFSSAWIYVGEWEEEHCASNCAQECAGYLEDDSGEAGLTLRLGLFDTVSPVASCQANTININWKDASGNTHELGSCTYDGALTTPDTAPTKRGHTFGGWKFVAQ